MTRVQSASLPRIIHRRRQLTTGSAAPGQMNAAKLLVGAAALLLTCAHSLIGYAQTDDGKKENANDDGSVLSAAKAEGAVNRVDVAISYIEQAPADQAVVESKYTRIIGSHHQVTVVAALVDSDIDSGSGLRAGDLRFGYSFTPNQKLTANPWVPSDVGIGMGLSIPTGDLDDGTGTGSWRLAPRLGYVATIGSNFVIAPSLEYIFSFGEETGAKEIRAAGLSVQMLYVAPEAFWVQWTPGYVYDIELDDGAFGNVIRIGKLFSQHFALSIDYGRLPVFSKTPGGSTTDYANVWTLGVHFPFNYGQ